MKWACEIQGEDRWRFPGSSFHHSPLGVEHPGSVPWYQDPEQRVQAWTSRDRKCSGPLLCPRGIRGGDSKQTLQTTGPSGQASQHPPHPHPEDTDEPRDPNCLLWQHLHSEPWCLAGGLHGLFTWPRSFPTRCSAP